MNRMPWEIETVEVPEAKVLPAILPDYQTVKSEITDINVTDENVTEVASFTKKLTGFEKEAKSAMKAELEPHETAAKSIKKKFKPLFDELTRLKGMCRSKLTTYQAGVERKQREAAEAERQRQVEAMRAEADRYADKGDFENAAAVTDTVQVVESEKLQTTRTFKGVDASTTLQTVWKYEITDPTQVPREFCEPARGLINAAVKRGTRSIPGVRIYSEKTVAIR